VETLQEAIDWMQDVFAQATEAKTDQVGPPCRNRTKFVPKQSTVPDHDIAVEDFDGVLSPENEREVRMYHALDLLRRTPGFLHVLPQGLWNSSSRISSLM